MKSVVTITAVLALVVPSLAHASFPGRDGRLAMVDGNGLLSMDPDGARKKRLLYDYYVGDPSFSPDGRRLLFSQRARILIARPDGTRRHRVRLPFRYATTPNWLPGGRRFTFFRIVPEGCGYFCVGENFRREFWSARADGAHVRRLGHKIPEADDDLVPAGLLSPSGRWRADLRSSACTRAVLTVSGRGHTVRRRVHLRPAVLQNCSGMGIADWSPDERRFAIVIGYSVPMCACPPDEKLFTIRRDGTHLHQVTDWLGGLGRVTWSPSGTRLAFAVRAGPRPLGVYVAGARGEPRLIAPNASSPSWQPLPR